MRQYLDLMQDILDNGKERGDRTGDGTISVFSREVRFEDVENNFPAVTTKKLAWQAMVGELLWFINGECTIPELKYRTFGDHNSNKWTIWTPNYEKQGKELGYDNGNCGPIYGVQWRYFEGVDDDYDQLQDTLNQIIANPMSRRHLVSAWNPTQIDEMVLPPCHWAFEFYVEDDTLNLKWHQRSVDVFLGLPFNIASYALLLKIFAKLTGYKAGTLIGDLTNVHIYKSHIEQVKEQLKRSPIKCDISVEMPEFSCWDDFKDFTAKDFKLHGYESHESIKAEMKA